MLWPCMMRSGACAVAPMCSGPACCVRMPVLWSCSGPACCVRVLPLWRQCALALRDEFGARAVALLWPCVLRSGARAVAPMCSGPACCVRLPALWRLRSGARSLALLWPCVLRSGARAQAPMCSGPHAFGCPRCGANVLWPCVQRSNARAESPMCFSPAFCVRVPALWRQWALALRVEFGCPRSGANVLWICVLRSGLTLTRSWFWCVWVLALTCFCAPLLGPALYVRTFWILGACPCYACAHCYFLS